MNWIHRILENAVDKAVQDEANRIAEEARKAEPLFGRLHRSAQWSYGRSPIDLPETIDSTAVVIDDDIKALPAPGETKQ